MCGPAFLHFSNHFGRDGHLSRLLLAGLFLLVSSVSLSAQESPEATTSQDSTPLTQTPTTINSETPSTTAMLDRSFDTLLTIIDQLEANSNSTDSIMQQLSQLSSEQLHDLQTALPLLLNTAALVSRIQSYTSRLDSLLPTLEQLSGLSQESLKPAAQHTNHWSVGGFAGIASDRTVFGGVSVSYSF